MERRIPSSFPSQTLSLTSMSAGGPRVGGTTGTQEGNNEKKGQNGKKVNHRAELVYRARRTQTINELCVE